MGSGARTDALSHLLRLPEGKAAADDPWMYSEVAILLKKGRVCYEERCVKSKHYGQ